MQPLDFEICEGNNSTSSSLSPRSLIRNMYSLLTYSAFFFSPPFCGTRDEVLGNPVVTPLIALKLDNQDLTTLKRTAAQRCQKNTYGPKLLYFPQHKLLPFDEMGELISLRKD